MAFEPPGLEERPEDDVLLGFRSLMPTQEKKPGVLARVIALPFKLLALPFKLAARLLRLPLRLFSRGGSDPGA